jgi:hypothetical protein
MWQGRKKRVEARAGPIRVSEASFELGGTVPVALRNPRLQHNENPPASDSVSVFHEALYVQIGSAVANLAVGSWSIG